MSNEDWRESSPHIGGDVASDMENMHRRRYLRLQIGATQALSWCHTSLK